MARRTHDFQTIYSEGGLLPPDLFRHVLDPKEKLPGTQPEDYGLPQDERINETITQSWNRLRRHWAEFSSAAQKLPEGEAGTGLTNDKWSVPLLRELGFGLLPTNPGPAINGRTYAISRFFGPTPIHLVGCGLSLDRRAAGMRGAAAVNPHGLVQEFLNRSDAHLWAIVSNGLRLRILRDNQALSRQSYLEFDLEAMFVGEVYSDFVLLWLIAHATRFVARDGGRPESCWLEQWTKLADEQGTRALGDLRQGVEKALETFGQGFFGHRRNTALREALRSGQLTLSDYHGQLLRVVYRLIFLFVAEDRTLDGMSLLHPRDDSDAARQARDHYASHYSTARLRELASKIKGSRHGDLWQQFNLLVGALSGEECFAVARAHLALPVLGSFLWDPASTAVLNAPSLTGGAGAELTNADLLEALRHLAFTRQGKVLRSVDYKNLGSEELGGVYESLLALTPQISGDGIRFTFAEFAGNERKTSGSYYTPDSLVQCLLDSALDPVVEEAIKGKTGAKAEQAILSLKVCDPAVGSGHFLVGAAHRLVRHLARVRALAQGESEPSPLFYQHALRDVIGRCLYGVDINPKAAELCRVSLWLEALEPGKPLSFLDHHIRVGNSLLGTTPELIAAGLPDDAFKPIEGDDQKACTVLKNRNKQERAGQQDLIHLMVAEPREKYLSLADQSSAINDIDDANMAGVREKEKRFGRLVDSPNYRHAKLVADAWCAAFVWRKSVRSIGTPACITTDTLRRLQTDTMAVTQGEMDEIHRLAKQYRFFHWHLAFPEVFTRGGFDVVLANPPWERVKLQEKEWFAERSTEIANAPNAAARKRLIEALRTEDPTLHVQFQDALRQAEGESHIMRKSALYPLCGRGDVNLYAVFAERMRGLLNSSGCMGCVLPTGIATDDTTKLFFQDLIETSSLASLFDFENRLGLFPAVDSRMKFCLLTSGSGTGRTVERAEFVFFAHGVEDLVDPNKRFELTGDDIYLLNPNTHTCPVFRSSRDTELSKAIYRRVPVVQNHSEPSHNAWQMNLLTMFHMANDSHLFRTSDQLRSEGWNLHQNVFSRGIEKYLPLYEGKMFMPYDHRHAHVVLTDNVGRHGQPQLCELHNRLDPLFVPQPEYWVPEAVVFAYRQRIGFDYFLAYKAVTAVTNERTALATVLPMYGIHDNATIVTFPVTEAPLTPVLLGNLNSFPFDYCTRQKMGTVKLMNYVFEQLPVLPPATYSHPCSWSDETQTLRGWLLPRVLELTYTAWDLESFAQDFGWSGPPFRWDEDRRFLLRCELDAAFFQLYLGLEDEWRKQPKSLTKAFPTPRDAVSYIMDTFPIVKRKDEAAHGHYRTKDTILEIYDALTDAQRTGQPYQTRLNSPPADPQCCHLVRSEA